MYLAANGKEDMLQNGIIKTLIKNGIARNATNQPISNETKTKSR